MKYLSRLIFGGIILISNACTQNFTLERDTMSFKTPSKTVEDSIRRMNNLMKQLPKNAEMINYFFDDDNKLYVNNLKLGSLKSIIPDSVIIFKKMNDIEKKSFLNIALSLKENEISGNYFDALFNTWRYSYKRTEDNSFRMYRDIFLKDENTSLDNIKQAHTILEEKGDLILIKGQ
jgi:hypothetical protein